MSSIYNCTIPMRHPSRWVVICRHMMAGPGWHMFYCEQTTWHSPNAQKQCVMGLMADFWPCIPSCKGDFFNLENPPPPPKKVSKQTWAVIYIWYKILLSIAKFSKPLRCLKNAEALTNNDLLKKMQTPEEDIYLNLHGKFRPLEIENKFIFIY